MKAQRGFTLIELVVVIVILGILAATAIPKFIDMSVDAGNASAQATAGALGSAAAINYAKFKAQGNTLSGGLTSITTGTNCTAAALSGLLTSGIPANITIAGGTASDCAAGGVSTKCTLQYSATGTTAYPATLACTL